MQQFAAKLLILHSVTCNIKQTRYHAYVKANPRRPGCRRPQTRQEGRGCRPRHRQDHHARRPPQGHSGRAGQHARPAEQGRQGDRHAHGSGPPRGGRRTQTLRHGPQGEVGAPAGRIEGRAGGAAVGTRLAAQLPGRHRARGQDRSRQPRREARRELHEAARKPAAALGAGPQVRHHRLRPGRQAHGRRIPRLQGQGCPPAARTDQLLPRLQHEGRIPRGRAARDGQRGLGLRHGTAPRQGGADVPRHGRQLLPHPDGRGPRDEHLPRRDPREGGLPGQDDGLHPLLPPRGGLLRQGRARPEPAAPVRQGRDRAAVPARGLLRGARRHGGPRRVDRPFARPALPHRAALRRRHVLHFGADLRL